MLFIQFLVIVLILYLYFTRHFNYWRTRNVHFVKPLPLVGNFLDAFLLRRPMGQLLQDLHEASSSPFTGFFILDEPALILKDPETIRQILVTDFKYFDNRSIEGNMNADPLASSTLFVLNNPEWKNVRMMVSPVFTSAKMKFMSKVIEQSGLQLEDFVDKLCRKNLTNDVKDICQRYTLDTVISAIFGTNPKAFDSGKSEILKNAFMIFDSNNLWSTFQLQAHFLFPKLADFFGLKLFNPDACAYFKQVFYKMVKERVASNESRNDLIDILLQLKKESEFPIDDVMVGQALMFIAAGVETSTAAMCFALFELAKNQTIQEKLRKDIDNVVDKTTEISHETVKKMHYLKYCVEETLRKYPIVPFVDRVCNTNYQIPNSNLIIEKNTKIFISSLALHYNPQYYPNPEVFDPERFIIDPNLTQSFVYMPFGKGPRTCLGDRFATMSIKIGLAHLLKKFVIKVCEDTPKTIEFQKNGIFLMPLRDFKLNFEPIG